MGRSMGRRGFALGAAALAVAPMAVRATEIALGPPTPMGQAKRVYANNPYVVQQHCAEWCWAASISMIFGSGGHEIDQLAIVQQSLGAVVCAPGAPLVIGNALSRNWVDQSGQSFSSTVTAAYDIYDGINNLDNSFIRDELLANRPLLYCNQHHAMVLVSFDFWDTPMGVRPIAAGVIDPWPYSPHYHPLTLAEMTPAHFNGQMTFVAAVEIA